MSIENESVYVGWLAEARKLGAADALRNASWVIDGNTSDATIVALLRMFDAGDPELSDHLPLAPDLSGEYADERTPRSLYEEVTGRDAHADATWNQDGYQAVLGEICDAYEEGVSEEFEPECERLVRNALKD